MNVPEEMQGSKALQYVIQKAWKWKQSDAERIELQQCPFCKKDGWAHFYMKCEAGNQDGLWLCHKCGKSGHLTDLKEEMGDSIKGVYDVGNKGGKAEEMPDIYAMHDALLADDAAMDYLVNGRGFSIEVIKQQKIGLSKRYYKKLGGEKLSIAYPYLIDGSPVFIHWRTLPPTQKEFSSLSGWEAPLYNGHILQAGIKDVVFVEGEANTIAALDHGIKDIVGVPGANFKKAMWLEQLDQLELEKIYVCYDKDKVGQKAAQVLASRIGINKCFKVVLPAFEVPNDDIVGTGQSLPATRPGKDLNEWFKYGDGTLEKWEELKKNAKKFDVDGVTDIVQGLEDLKDLIAGKQGLLPKYMMPWSSMRGLIGLEDGDVLDIIAPEKIGKSIFAMNLMEWLVNEYGEDGVDICLEMDNNRQLRRWVSHVAQVEDRISLDPAEAVSLKDKFMAGIDVALAKHKGRQGNLYFCYPTSVTSVDDMEKLIVDCIRRYGVKFVLVDNLQLLSGRTLKSDQRTIHLDKISKMLQKIGKDYGVIMIRIVQPHSIRAGMLCTADDSDGSSQLRKDCDGTIVLNRAKKPEMSMEALKNTNQVTQTDAAFDRKLLATVGLSRYSAGGETTLDFVGETSTVREYNAALLAAEAAQKKIQEKYHGIDEIGGQPSGEGQAPAGDLPPDIGAI